LPLYEYYCRDCDGVFELLRPARESGASQPCPECDRDAARLMPKDFSTFTLRDGLPRRIPDRGTYWHLGQEVSSPVDRPAYSWQHPEIDKPPPVTAPTNEEVEAFDYKVEQETQKDKEAAARGTLAIQPQREREREQFLKRLEQTGGTRRIRPRTPKDFSLD
jgi:putative FmdB family regulatory protein